MRLDNFMVDLETMGTKPYSVIASIGVVTFDLRTGELGLEFYRTIDQQSCLDAGLTIDPATAEWWSKQDPRIKAQLYVDTAPLAEVLGDFSAWIKSQTSSYKYLWGNGATFDLALLSQAYDKIGMYIPWGYWNERCVRTIVALNPAIKDRMAKPSGLHHPIADCKYQIEYVVKTIESFKTLHNRGTQ